MYTMANLYLVGAIIALVVVFSAVRIRHRYPLPPGPKGRWPLLGMTFDMPTGRPWEYMASWAEYVLVECGNKSNVGLD